MKKSELKKEIRERILEKKCKTADIDEMSTSGGAGAYNTPYAFKPKKKDSVNERLGVSKDKLSNIVKFVGAVNFAQMVISLRDENIQDEIVSAFEDQYPAVMGKEDDLQEIKEDFMKMGHLATNDDGVKKPIYLNYGYKLVDKSKS